MPSRSAVYAQARKHAEAEKAFADALAKRVAAEREALLRRRNAEDILPQQVWLQILGQIDDCNFLWSSCHNVCKTFRHSVETIFAEDHIRNSKTLITFDVGEEISGEKKHSLGLELAFDRFSNDESRVYFKESKAVPRQFGVLKASWEQWKDVLEKEHLDERADNPPFTIAVRRFVNDTELPGLRIDHEEREISFDWRGMYTCFFREEDWVERQEALWARDHLALSPASRQRISAKDMDEVAAMTLLFDKLEDVYNSARQNIRRHRIRKGSKRTKGLDWNHDRCVNEAKKLRQMREARAMASFLEFSDDEYAGSLLGSSRNSPITIDLTSSRQCIVPEAVAVIS